MKYLICLFLLFCSKTNAAGNANYTFNYNTAMRCKEHLSTHGYSYETFYRIDEESFKHTTVKKENTTVTYIEMHIAIQAASNGHILLSSKPFPGRVDPVYEIVVGGGGNKFTELRLNLKRNARSSTKTPGILSAIDFTAFFIKISDDGLVEFGREGDSLPLISYYDAHTLPIRYFSFASWTGVEAKFLYDCPPPGDSDAISPDSQAVEPKLSNSDELKRELLMSRMPSISPSPIVSVKLGTKVTHVRYNPFDEKMVTRMAVVMSWTDESLAWNPNKFNGTTRLKFRQGQIWRPMFFVYNSDKIDVFDTKNPDMISVLHSGEATFHFQTEVTTHCYGSITLMNQWPHDSYYCFIIIEPWEVHEKIKIEIINQTDYRMKVFADIDEFIKNEWEVNLDFEMIIKPQVWFSSGTTEEIPISVSNNSDRYAIGVHMTRKATTYNIVFYTPLIVLVTFVLMSFWSDPLEESRIMFYAGCSIIICLGLSYIDFLVPTTTVPSILVLYESVLYSVLAALFVNCVLLTETADKISKSRTMKNILSSWFLRTIFFLPTIQISKTNGDYMRQDDEDDISFASSSKVEEMESENSRTYADKKELAEVLDKFMFVTFAFSFACMLSAHY